MSDFKDLALQLAYEYHPSALMDPITYNPQKETITISSYSESALNNAMIHLRLLADKFSKHRGKKYLMASDPSMSRAPVIKPPSSQDSTRSETTRIFPIRPTVHRPQVQLWFNSILPALPRILSERLGGNYAACLVLRGQNALRAKPCIQIESPRLPAPAAQRTMQDFIREICKKEQIDPNSISMHFTEGSVRNLIAVEDHNDHVLSADTQALELNYGRPDSKPGMGASIGLLCSKKVSATLGGYVLIDGEKFILTAEHFVSYSQEPANRDGNGPEVNTLTSPSLQELNKIEQNLKQTKRDLDGQFNELFLTNFGDNVIPQGACDPTHLPSKLRDIWCRIEDVKSLLCQVTKAPVEYVVGSVVHWGLGKRTGILPESLATLNIANDQRVVTYKMDWALFDTKTQRAHNGENRHKYRSNEAAMRDLYVEEIDHKYLPGDVCHETCGAEIGRPVSYVGQGSKRRTGKVNLPMLVSIDASETFAWSIISPDGETMYDDVAGDSGAWVINDDNKLMGQVHSYGIGQVLFTPIADIFADISAYAGSDVSLPPRSSNSGQAPGAIVARPLCSVPRTPPVKPYAFLKSHPMTANISLETSPVEALVTEVMPFELPSEATSQNDTESAHSQSSSLPSCGSPSTLPSLINSPRTSATSPQCPKSPRLSGDQDCSVGRVDTEKLSPKSFPEILDESSTFDITDLSLDEHGEDQLAKLKPYAFPKVGKSLVQFASGKHVLPWPVGFSGRNTQARRGFETSPRDHDEPFSTRLAILTTCSHSK